MTYNKKQYLNGFTLIELLVVIAIAAVIATILMVNFNGIRERNRDVRRKADLKEMQSLLFSKSFT